MILGSGGHTSELMRLVEDISFGATCEGHLILAETDHTSIPRMRMKYGDKFDKMFSIDTIPRAREVGQSYITSIFTTLKSIYTSIFVVYASKPDLILCNGPGTCIPIVLSAAVMRQFGFISPRLKLVFVESFCRTEHLSLSGKILKYVVDEFVVLWPQLAQKGGREKYLGVLL